MQITKIEVTILKNPSKQTRGYANITFDNAIKIDDFTIVEDDGKKKPENAGKLFVGNPSKSTPRGYFKMVWIDDTNLYIDIQKKVLEAYYSKLNSGESSDDLPF